MAAREAMLENELKAAAAREEDSLRRISWLQSELAALEEAMLDIQANQLEHQTRLTALGPLIRKVVHEFMCDVKKFQTSLLGVDKTSGATPPSCTVHNPFCKCQHVQNTNEFAGLVGLNSCLETLKLVTHYAKSGWRQATKDWGKHNARAYDLREEAQKCFYNTILGKEYSFTQEFPNPITINFRLEPELEVEAKEKLRRTLHDHTTEMEANQIKAAKAAAGTSRNGGVQPN